MGNVKPAALLIAVTGGVLGALAGVGLVPAVVLGGVAGAVAQYKLGASK